LGSRKRQTQFSLHVPENFGTALPFGDELALARVQGLRCRVRAHVTLSCFDGSAHMFLSFL